MQNAGFFSCDSFTSCTTLPVLRSTHTAKNVTSSTDPRWPGAVGALTVLPLSTSSAVVIQTWLPHTTGDDQPLPWTAVFQRTFSPVFSSQVVGILASSAWPSPVGPRNCG